MTDLDMTVYTNMQIERLGEMPILHMPLLETEDKDRYGVPIIAIKIAPATYKEVAHWLHRRGKFLYSYKEVRAWVKTEKRLQKERLKRGI